MSAGEFGHWLAFFEQEPPASQVGLVQWAELLAAVYNGPRTKRGNALWMASDFAGTPWAPPKTPKRASGQDARAHIKALKAARGG